MHLCEVAERIIFLGLGNGGAERLVERNVSFESWPPSSDWEKNRVLADFGSGLRGEMEVCCRAVKRYGVKLMFWRVEGCYVVEQGFS